MSSAEATPGLPPVAERVAVDSPAQVSTARMLASRAARAAGLPRERVDVVTLVATELAENLHRHARGGELIVIPPRAGRGAAAAQLAVVAVDRGPGVEHFESCMRDGFSTEGTLGTGLGAVRRLADTFDALSEPGIGTLLWTGFTVPGVPPGIDDRFAVGAFGLPLDGQIASGDDYALARRGSRLVVMVSDGLGHGVDAAFASRAAGGEFAHAAAQAQAPEPAHIVSAIHSGMSSRRGAAVTVVGLELDAARRGGFAASSGLGNVSLLVAGPDGTSKRVAMQAGTAGVRSRSVVKEYETPFPARGLLILHTDGLTSRWTLERRTGLLHHSPSLIAAVLWRDHARASDDSLVTVVRAGRSATQP